MSKSDSATDCDPVVSPGPNVGVIGLGLLGAAISDRLMMQGCDVTGLDTSLAACEQFANAGGRVADTPGEIAECPRIILSLPTSVVALEVIRSLTPLLRSGTVIIDTTTGSPGDAEAAATALSRRGVEYLDATVGGSSTQARHGDAIIMCGATENGFDRARQTLSQLAHRVFHIGPPGSGSRMAGWTGG